ncbi:hypothetical protein JCGZ_16666 [Jatropha curcas]|uniref:Aminotransferase-like plant mobile domain-containing protein n=1 Tax=Jatropha curcas TaxID=180498 RepID=A0A067K2S4_JATCU|nr:hypothetical protein JCGZ_16666 [Jatropha curcas]
MNTLPWGARVNSAIQHTGADGLVDGFHTYIPSAIQRDAHHTDRFAAITRLLFGGRSMVFNDRIRILDCPVLWASLRVAISMEPTISDQRDLDATGQFKAAGLSYLYYGMDLSIQGAHLKVSYKWAIEIWACESKVLPMHDLFSFEGEVNMRTLPRGRAWRYSRRYSHTTSDIGMFRQLLNGLSWDWHRHLLLPSLFYDMYYLRERVYEWELSPDRRRVPHDVPCYMLSARSIQLEQDIIAA